MEELKEEAESGQEHFEQEATTAKVTLAKFGSEANKIDAIALTSAMENHLSSQLAELKKVTDKTAEVAGDPHQLNPIERSRRGVARCKHFQLFVPSCKGGGI